MTYSAIAIVLGAVLGSLGTLVIELFLRWRRSKIETYRLRHALLAELSSMDDLLPKLDPSAKSQALERTLPNEIFSSNSSQISLLSDGEVYPLVRFYGGARKIERLTESAFKLRIAGESDNIDANIEEMS